MSALNDILTAVVTQTTGLGLTAPGASAPMQVVLRKLPRAEEGLNPSSQIIVCKAQKPEKVRWLSFPNATQPTGTVRVEYLILVVIIIPGNADYVSNIDAYATMRASVRSQFQGGKTPALSGASTVIDLDIMPDDWLPEELLKAQYDYQVVGVTVTSIEAAG